MNLHHNKILEIGLRIFRKTCVLPQTVNFNYLDEPERHGKTIVISYPNRKKIAVTNVVPGKSPPTTADIAHDFVGVHLSWEERGFDFPNKNMSDIMTSHKSLIEGAAASLGEYVSKDLLNVYKETNQFVEELDSSNSRVVPFTDGKITSFAAAQRKLREADALPKDRLLVLNPATEEKVSDVREFKKTSYVGDKNTIRERRVGSILHFDVYPAQQALKHTTKAAGSFLVNQTDLAVGDNEVTVDGGTTAPAAGDIFSVTDDTQTYVIVDKRLDGTPASNTTTKFSFYPAAKVAWANNAAITFKASHYVNLAFQENAILFVSRPLRTQGVDKIIPPDKVGGLGLHLRVTAENKYAFGILYGYRAARPQQVVRIASPE